MKNFYFLLISLFLVSACQETDPSKRVPKAERAAAQAANAASNGTAPSASSQKRKGEFPEPLGFVSDFSGILNNAQRDSLETMIIAHQEKTTNEIAVVTVRDISPYTDIFEYAFDLANAWGVGVIDKNNGVVIVLNDSLGLVRINTGLGTEKILVDTVVQEIIDQQMIPKFAELNLYEGLRDGTLEIIRKLEE